MISNIISRPRGHSAKFYTGKLRLEFQPLLCHPSISICYRKRYPFHIPSLDRWYSFRIPN